MIPVLSHRRCSHMARLTSLVLITTLHGCHEQTSVYPSDLESSECRFERMGLARLTLSRQLGTASLTTRLSAAASGSQSPRGTEGLKSLGRLVGSSGSSLVLEFFLLNDAFAQQPKELVQLRLARDGRTLLQARSPNGRTRDLDFGTCLLSDRP